MKKLFTTLLLLGAVGYAQAQVTVTGYDATKKTVTINYDRAAGKATEAMVKGAIDKAFNGPNATMAQLDGQKKSAISTIIFTGDWDNEDTDQANGKTIKKAVDELSDANNPVTLDFSACQKFMSKFVSVEDKLQGGSAFAYNQTSPGYEGDRYEVKFTAITKLPDETLTGTGNLTTKFYYSWGDEYTGNPVQHADGTWWNEEGWGQLTQKTVVTDDNGNVMTVNSYTDNGDGTCTYSIAVTHKDTPFAITKDYPTVDGIIFPSSPNFTFIPNELCYNSNVTKIFIPSGIVAIGTSAFQNTGISEVTLPSTITEIGGLAFEGTNLVNVDLSATKIRRLRYATFEDCYSLETVTFPTTLFEIQKEAFYQDKKLKEVDLSNCHELRLIAQKSFAECHEVTGKQNIGGKDFDICEGLTTVTVCSHPKVIRGGEGSGAFNNTKSIKTVEIVGCDNTNVVECICESNAFDPQITYVQTALDAIEPYGARLIFPDGQKYDQPMQHSAGNLNTEYMGYVSTFDYFVGNYKEGVPFRQNQSALEAYFRFASRGDQATAVNHPSSGQNTTVFVPSDNKMKQVNGIGNGWHEFINVSTGIVIHNEDDHFLRTYSRTRGSGPVLLRTDLGITAYRAIDYISTKSEYVANKRGDYVFVPGSKNKLHPGEDEYLTKKQCEAAGINIKGLKTYSYATVAGKLYLRPLHPKFNNSTNAVNENYSYIPELTGVVLYSNKTNEDMFLIFAPYTGTEYDLSIQYPHTGMDRRESTRLETEADNINMLQGSYGEDTGVAPVDPWTYADEENFIGGTYNPAKIDYRQFGYSISQEKWLRLQPGRMKYNRAFAKIPAAFFNNHNETTDQMPDFTLSDMPEEPTPETTENGANTLLLIDYTFDDIVAETDGIKTVNETQVADNNAWYTLQGVKVTQPVKGGVYIHNNKKVVIK